MIGNEVWRLVQSSVSLNASFKYRVSVAKIFFEFEIWNRSQSTSIMDLVGSSMIKIFASRHDFTTTLIFRRAALSQNEKSL